MALKLVRDELTLVYGMRLFRGRMPDGGELPHPHVTIAAAGGADDDMPLHTISGTRDEIRKQLLQSIEAFFDLVEPSGEPEPGSEPAPK
jgi:hypothetical protein